MENEKNVPVEGREMNFWDLCVACARAIGRGCVALWHLIARMIRLTYRYWYIVITLVVLALCVAFYYTRQENTIYRVNAVAMLNGPSINQFEQALAPIQSGKNLSAEAPIAHYVWERKVSYFSTYRVLDCLADGTADMIDFKRKSSPTDTVKVQMQDRLCLQFRIKERDLEALPQIEEALLATLNADPAMLKSHECYLRNLKDEAAFNHTQALKLDSLTSVYYFNNPAISTAEVKPHNTGVAFYGDRKIKLFLDDIYEQQKHTQLGDYRLLLASQPIVLENHFAVDPNPVNGRIKYLILFFLIGWIGGCLIAQIVDKRKNIAEWLKQA